MGEPTGLPIYTYRVANVVQQQSVTGNVYFTIPLAGTPEITRLTTATNYEVKILDSIEVQLAQ